MILVFAFARRVNAGNVAGLIFAIHPDPAHGVVHGWKYSHRLNARIDAEEFLVNLQNPFELAIQRFARDVRHI